MIAVNARRNAVINPKAVYRDPMTLDDYYASRMVTTPFRLFDCDAPVDGSTAVIVSAVEHATDVDHPVARVEAVGTALRGRPSWDQFDDATTMAARDAGAHLWERTDLKPADVDVAQLYDGFSFLAMTWLEALGFCGKGRERPLHRGRAPDRARGRAAPQHPRRPAVGRPAPRVRLRPRGLPPAARWCGRAPGAEGRGGRGRRQRRRPDRRSDAPHEARLMAFDQDALVACLDLAEVEPGGRRRAEPRHRVPPGVRRTDPRPGPHRRRRRVAGQGGEVAAHPVPPGGRHGQAHAVPGDEAAGRPHVRHHGDRRRAGRQGDLCRRDLDARREERAPPHRRAAAGRSARGRHARSTSAWFRGRRASSAGSISPTRRRDRPSSTGGP